MLVDFFIRRPVLSTVCALLIVLGGAISIPTLPIAQYPELASPQVVVRSTYTGASAQVVETTVTTPLEQAINGVEGMRYMSSTSGSDGASEITVTFDVTRNRDLAAVDVQNRVSNALGQLPGEVQQTGVTVTKSSAGFLMAIGLYAEHGEYTNTFISNYADVYLRDALKRIEGVSDVRIFGERRYAMRIWLDPRRLASRNLTASDVVSALREQNVQIAAGQVGQQPARQGQTYQMSVRVLGRLTDPAEFGALVLKTGADGRLVQLRDVGTAELGAQDYNTILRFNGRDAVGLGIIQLPNANALDIYRAVVQELQRLATRFPPGLKYTVSFDTATFVRESVDEVLRTLAEAIGLVVLVMFAFLQSWRATLIPSVAIPVSLVGTFAFVKLFGFSINTLTLFGLTLATGLVVDDAIVVIENIERHVRETARPVREAAAAAMHEVAGAVVAMSLVLMAVFVPVALFPGTTGRLYQQFALTIAFSIALSAFNALTFTPALSALVIRRVHVRHRGVFGLLNRGLEWVIAAYRASLGSALRFTWAIVAVFAGALGLTYWMYRVIPTAFVPEEDQGYFLVNVQAPSGASLQYTRGVIEQAEGVLRGEPSVANIFGVAGFSFTGAAPNKGIMFVTLKPFVARRAPEQSAAAIIGRLRGALGRIPDALVQPFPPPPIRGIGTYGGFQFELQDLVGESPETLARVAGEPIARGNRRPELRGLFTAFTANDPQFLVTIDREKAKSLRVPLSEITSALQVYMGSVYVNDFTFNNRSYRVYVQADPAFRSEPKDIGQFYVRSQTGEMFPLDNVVRVREITGPQTITRYNMFRSAEITGSAAPGYSSGQALEAMADLAREVLPQGMAYEWSGVAREEIEAGGTAVLLFALGVLVVYLILSAQYESFGLPFVIMLAVPLAILGALAAQWLRGLPNDVFCQIGLLMLVGLATKNAILIVEFAERLREQGRSLVEATVEAARIRFRPIVMTSLAFTIGILPLVVASGAGSAARHSLGTAVFGGMIVSTLLNLYFTPVLYVAFERVRARLRRWGQGAAAEAA